MSCWAAGQANWQGQIDREGAIRTLKPLWTLLSNALPISGCNCIPIAAEGLYLLPGKLLWTNRPRGHHTNRHSHGLFQTTALQRDSQYYSHDYQKVLRQHGFKISISGKGNCYGNAAALRRENSLPDCFLILLTFFKTIKAELIWRRTWETRKQAEKAIFEYINDFYNPRPRRSALGWKSPVAFE
jgi:transposase InsO family protein